VYLEAPQTTPTLNILLSVIWYYYVTLLTSLVTFIKEFIKYCHPNVLEVHPLANY
jgi:hypothetical protein